ncbi:efflux transporter, RND family, MFP subunit [Rhodopirellula maiorica SM1]|uniref:Efflux transporter, RND family, MFP subunit n=1 Tax=Rhodopirellula maiorica SM1 TaxID=1265738 RepID=M5RL24_9BACT|nr:HlyD family efflux transporter periplasmic adaptor subunit [Rhodopirellula maiorica]EMI19881.1 efflux transporter, RND family, MFP subunit [Rhodopirellula maiorica SM1]
MTRSQLDLSQLAMDRSPRGETTAAHTSRKRWVSRYGVPIGILVGFVMLIGAAAGRRLLPQHAVTVVPVIVKRTELQPSGTPLFQAAGWIEPRPTAIRVAALASGVIEELLVVEGQSVSKGEPIASLIAIDAELAVEQAKNSLAIREGELNRAIAERDAAKIRLQNPVHLQVPLSDAESRLAKAQTELAKLPFLIEAAQAQVKFSLSSMQGKRAAEEAIARRIVQQSESEYAAAMANLHELQQRGPNIQQEVKALQGKVDALQQQLELLVEETRQLQEAEAKVASAIGLRNEAKLRLRQAELTLQRNTVLAPMDGRILSLVASPGTRVTGIDGSSGQGSSTVVEMYDPERLQVRADVRLEDVPMVTRGQSVEIKTASSDGVIQGRVLQMTSSANIQKNTLEVKVELIDPPPTVSPEMLVTTTFLAPIVAVSNDEIIQSERVFAPQRLIQSSDERSFVWIVDFDQRAQRRSIETGNPAADGLIEIQSGLNVTDKLIATGQDGLQPGKPVIVTGDAPSIEQ